MTEKRYYVNCGGYLCDTDLSNTLTIFECAKLLNKLNDENEQLKTFLEALKEELSLANRDNTDLEKENEQLKQQLSDIDRLIDDLGSEEMCRQYNEIIKELQE